MSTWIIKIWKLPFAYLPDYNQQLKHLWNVQCLNYKKDFVILDSLWLTIINHRIICYQEVWCSFPDIYMKYKRTQNRNPSIQKIGNSNLFKVATKAKPHWRCSGVFIVNFEHISHLFLMFLLFTKNKKMLTVNNIFFFFDNLGSVVFNICHLYNERLAISLCIFETPKVVMKTSGQRPTLQ